MRYFHYLEPEKDTVVRVRASRRPNHNTMPPSGSWVVRERIGGKWVMPAFPEAGWGALKKLEYLGSSEIEEHRK